MLIDLHVQAPADAEALEALLQAGVKAGLGGMCLVGAGTVPPVAQARTSPSAAGLALFFGVEFLCSRGRLVWLPRELSLLESEEWRPFAGRDADGVKRMVTELGGLLFAAHPYDRSQGPSFSDAVFQLDFIHAIEVANHGLFQVRNLMAYEAASRMKVATVGGSDSSDPAVIGRAATVFLSDVRTQAEVVDAVLRGDVWAVELLDRLEKAPEGTTAMRTSPARLDAGSRGRGRRRGGRQRSA